MASTAGVTFAVGATMSASVASVFSTVDARLKGLKGNLKELRTVSAKAANLLSAEARLRDARQAHAARPTEETASALRSAQSAYNSAERAAKKYNVTVAGAAKAHAHLSGLPARRGAFQSCFRSSPQ